MPSKEEMGEPTSGKKKKTIGRKNKLHPINTGLNFHVILLRAIGAVWLKMTVTALDAKSAMDIPFARIFVGRTSAAYAYGDAAKVLPKKKMKTITMPIPAFPQPDSRISALAKR